MDGDGEAETQQGQGLLGAALAETRQGQGLLGAALAEITGSWLNSALLVLIVVLVYKIFRKKHQPEVAPPEPDLPKIRCDLTAAQLSHYDGNQPDGRVLVAVCGTIFDVTKNKRFYGPGGPYAAFGGHDASRGLATFSVTTTDKEYDDLGDLDEMQMDSVKEWAMQFREKYDVVGRLLKPGEEPTNYSDEETEPDTPSATESKKAQ